MKKGCAAELIYESFPICIQINGLVRAKQTPNAPQIRQNNVKQSKTKILTIPIMSVTGKELMRNIFGSFQPFQAKKNFGHFRLKNVPANSFQSFYLLFLSFSLSR